MKNIKMKKTSTTNILAKIFKKTPEKKVKKKTKAKVAKKPTLPKAKVVKKNISVKKTKTIKATPTKIKKNLKTVSKKAVPEKVEIKTDNLIIQNMALAKLQSLKKLILVELMLKLMFLNLKKTKPMVWFL